MEGKNIRGLMEAYSQVHTPQELTEEQVWEEVENWVNSLLEEGYDLSEYTWEEMYEAYIEEQGGRGGAAVRNQNVFTIPTSSAGTRRGAAAGTRPGATPKPAAGIPPKPVAATPAAAKPTATPAAAKPTATPAAAKPTATPAAAKPAGPATGMLGKTSFERRTPTSAELKGAQAARAGGAKPEAALQAAKSAGGALSQATAAASKPPAFNPTPAAAAPKPTPAAAPKKSPREMRLNMSFDVFDMVLGYLLDEGYAETEQAAMVMMTNMSQGWRESILESCGIEILDEAEVMKFQQEKDAIKRRMKMKGYEPPTKGPHAEKKAPTRLRSGSLPEEYVDEAQAARND